MRNDLGVFGPAKWRQPVVVLIRCIRSRLWRCSLPVAIVAMAWSGACSSDSTNAAGSDTTDASRPSTTVAPTSPTTTPAAGAPARARVVLEAETNPGSAQVMPRGNASNRATVLLLPGGALTLRAQITAPAAYALSIRYSNDGPGTPPEKLDVSLDGSAVSQVAAENTRGATMAPGSGWNEFRSSLVLGPVELAAGPHTIVVAVSGGDSYGVEIDAVTLE